MTNKNSNYNSQESGTKRQQIFDVRLESFCKHTLLKSQRSQTTPGCDVMMPTIPSNSQSICCG